MNIFDQYLDNLKKILLDLSKQGEIILPDKLDGINAEIPPEKFNCDISTNVAMVLSKINKKTPIDLAEILAEIIKKKDPLINEISVVKPGFINIKFKPIFWTNFIKEIIKRTIPPNKYGLKNRLKEIPDAKIGIISVFEAILLVKYTTVKKASIGVRRLYNQGIKLK